MSIQTIDFKSHVKELLLKHKDADIDEIGSWDLELANELLKLRSTHGDDLILALKDIIFELDNNYGCIEMLFESTFLREEFECIAMKNALLNIFDNSKQDNIRRMALSALIMFDSMDDLQSRYKIEHEDIKNNIGEAIVAMMVKKAKLPSYGLAGIAYKTNIEDFKKNLLLILNTDKERVNLIKFLLNCEYISDKMKISLKEILKKIGD